MKEQSKPETARQAIMNGEVYLGIELGSTRIKAVLIDSGHLPLASGSHEWENSLENGVWTYPLEKVWTGLQDSYAKLAAEVEKQYGVSLVKLAGMGVSAMMHGYLAFDGTGEQLVPFRTWRNTFTEQAAAELTALFGFNIPQRWSVAHLHHAVLQKEQHVGEIAFLTTLSGYVHWKLTGEKVLGVGDASGMFPIDSATGSYNARMCGQYNAIAQEKKLGWKIDEILPRVLSAGQPAGQLSPEGARLLDPAGRLLPGVLMCPPEGDAGSGMVATNSVAKRTGNVSAGTSIFAMVVLEQELSKVYTEIDMVTTPAGRPVAMVHCNSCTSDLDAWVNLFSELLQTMGVSFSKAKLYDELYFKAMEGDPDGGGLMSYNYYSGEPITGLEEGRPLFMRLPDSSFNLGNFMRTQLYSTMGTLRIGMDILTRNERVEMDRLYGHGGLFKTIGVGQKLMAAALKVPVAVMESAAEGGAWGIALLAAFSRQKETGQTLEEYLAARVFAGVEGSVERPNPVDMAGFDTFLERYSKGLDVQRAAVENFK